MKETHILYKLKTLSFERPIHTQAPQYVGFFATLWKTLFMSDKRFWLIIRIILFVAVSVFTAGLIKEFVFN